MKRELCESAGCVLCVANHKQANAQLADCPKEDVSELIILSNDALNTFNEAFHYMAYHFK